MEVRKIYVNDTARNNVVTVETDATTFGELKAAVRAAGVDIEGKDWLEGLTKTSPASDDALLPTNVPYQGNITNDLVFVLTKTNKMIKSGAMSYNEMKTFIKSNNLGEAFKEAYGKNYTHGTSSEFEEFIASYQEDTVQEVPAEVENYEYKYKCLVNAFATFLCTANTEVVDDINKAANAITAHLPKPLNLSEEDVMKFM